MTKYPYGKSYTIRLDPQTLLRLKRYLKASKLKKSAGTELLLKEILDKKEKSCN